MNLFLLFILMVTACLCAVIICAIIFDSVTTNVRYYARVRDPFFNYLAIIRYSAHQLRERGHTDEEIHGELKRRMEIPTYRFLRHRNMSQKHFVAVNLLKHVVIDDDLFTEFVISEDPVDIKTISVIKKRLSHDELERKAKGSLMKIMKDAAPGSIDKSMRWLPQLLSRPFVPDPEDFDRKINDGEYFTAIYVVLVGEFLKPGVTYDEYIDCMSSLKQCFPSMCAIKSKSSITTYRDSVMKNNNWLNEIRASINAYIHM